MKYYEEYKYRTQQKCYDAPVENSAYLDEPSLLGAAEVTKNWSLLESSPFEPYIEKLRHDNFAQFNNHQWNVFAVSAVEEMKKIAINSPNVSDTIIYCDFFHQDKIILLEVDKGLTYYTLTQKLPKHILKNYRLHTEDSFEKGFKSINEQTLCLPLSKHIDRHDFIRHLIIEL